MSYAECKQWKHSDKNVLLTQKKAVADNQNGQKFEKKLNEHEMDESTDVGKSKIPHIAHHFNDHLPQYPGLS